MKPHVLLVSGTGFLGQALAAGLGQRFQVTATGRRTGSLALDLSEPVAPQVRSAFTREQFTHVVVCAAQADVEACLRDPAGSRRVNVEAPRELFRLAIDSGAQPIFFSSDLVFGGREGLHREDATPSPGTVYGRQKLEMEEIIRREFSSALVFRTSKLMSTRPHPRCILSGLRAALEKKEPVRVFRDQFITPVFVEDVAAATGAAISAGSRGTFHLAAPGILTREAIARALCRIYGLDEGLIEPISIREFSFGEERGAHNTIDSGEIRRRLGVHFRTLDEGLRNP